MAGVLARRFAAVFSAAALLVPTRSALGHSQASACREALSLLGSCKPSSTGDSTAEECCRGFRLLTQEVCSCEERLGAIEELLFSPEDTALGLCGAPDPFRQVLEGCSSSSRGSLTDAAASGALMTELRAVSELDELLRGLEASSLPGMKQEDYQLIVDQQIGREGSSRVDVDIMVPQLGSPQSHEDLDMELIMPGLVGKQGSAGGDAVDIDIILDNDLLESAFAIPLAGNLNIDVDVEAPGALGAQPGQGESVEAAIDIMLTGAPDEAARLLDWASGWARGLLAGMFSQGIPSQGIPSGDRMDQNENLQQVLRLLAPLMQGQEAMDIELDIDIGYDASLPRGTTLLDIDLEASMGPILRSPEILPRGLLVHAHPGRALGPVKPLIGPLEARSWQLGQGGQQRTVEPAVPRCQGLPGCSLVVRMRPLLDAALAVESVVLLALLCALALCHIAYHSSQRSKLPSSPKLEDLQQPLIEEAALYVDHEQQASVPTLSPLWLHTRQG